MNSYEKDNRNAIRMQTVITDRPLTVELSEDFSLPDYQPEMKRLQRVKVTAMPPDIYIGSSGAECSGTVDYSILYSGNDGALYHTAQSGNYRFTIPMESVEDLELSDGFLCEVDLLPELANGRVLAPRRLSTKCRLRANAKIYATRCLCSDVGEGEHMERLCGEGISARVFLGTGDPIQLADEILCEEKNRNLRVICGEGQVFVTEANARSGAVSARGELCLKLLCCREEEGETPFALWRRIPFSGEIPVEGAEVNCEASVKGVCNELNITVEEGRILCEAAILLRAKAERNERFSYVRDLYSTKQESKVSHKAPEIPILLRVINGNFSLNSALMLEELGIRPSCGLADLTGEVQILGVTQEKGKCYVSGKCRMTAILTDADEVGSHELEIPFRYECDGVEGEITENALSAETVSCKGRIDGERIGVDAEIAVCGSLRGKQTVTMACDCELGEAWQEQGAVYTVCYPARDDTLWSVARRYHRSVEEILSRNSLAGSPAADAKDSLAGVGFLVV